MLEDIFKISVSSARLLKHLPSSNEYRVEKLVRDEEHERSVRCKRREVARCRRNRFNYKYENKISVNSHLFSDKYLPGSGNPCMILISAYQPIKLYFVVH